MINVLSTDRTDGEIGATLQNSSENCIPFASEHCNEICNKLKNEALTACLEIAATLHSSPEGSLLRIDENCCLPTARATFLFAAEVASAKAGC